MSEENVESIRQAYAAYNAALSAANPREAIRAWLERFADPEVELDREPTWVDNLGVDGECLHDWLGPWTGKSAGFDPPGPSAKVFEESMATGAVVVGRRTFDLAGRWGGDHHGVPIFIPTTGTPPPPESDWVNYVTDGVESAMRQAKDAAGESNVMVHGASLAQSLLRAGVLDEMEIHLVPVLLGEGRRLFEHGADHTDLELT